MRRTVFAVSILLATAGLAKAETAVPIFGGQGSGTFQVADQVAEARQSTKVMVQAANDCASPDCTPLLKTANLPVSGKKP